MVYAFISRYCKPSVVHIFTIFEMSDLTLKVKCKTGQFVVKDLQQTNTVLDLKKSLSSLCQISENRLHVLHGFPPKPLNLDEESKSLVDSGLTSGETLIVQEKIQEISQVESEPSVDKTGDIISDKEPNDSKETRLGVLLRKIVPADNSCLFTSIGYVLSGKIDLNCGSYMRQVIAEHVSADQETFNEAVLGKPPREYCQWILKADSWGGAIEISILSKYYGLEIAVVDTLNAIINRFGEDQAYPTRVFLIFDGIHYDPLYLESPMADLNQTIFPSEDEQILEDAKVLAVESKSSRQFTDVNKFVIKCLICHTMLKGQAEAQAHAEATKHVSFGEV